MRYKTFAYGSRIFSDDEIANIKSLFNQLEKRPGRLYGQENIDTAAVNFVGSRVQHIEDTSWISKRIYEKVCELNLKTYKYDIKGIDEQMYYMTYDSQYEHHFNWHVDSGPSTPHPRKLTAVVQLSDPQEYTGGELQIRQPTEDISLPKGLGVLNIFPSYRIHKVTPMLNGIRNTLVAFITGPEFL